MSRDWTLSLSMEVGMYQRILVPVDGSATAQCGVEEAIRMARTTGGTLRFFHAIDDQSFSIAMQSSIAYIDNWRAELKAEGTAVLEAALDLAKAAGVPGESTLSDDFSIPVHERVVLEARRWPADLLVIGTHGRRGIRRLFLGSSAEAILRQSPVPVLLVRSPNALTSIAEHRLATDDVKEFATE